MEAAFQEYLSCIAECFGKPYDDRCESAKRESTESLEEQGVTSLRSVCDEFGISIPKARKLLITAGVFSTEQSRRVAALTAENKTLAEIMALTGLSRSSVSSYLPYRKFAYNMKEASRHAADSRIYRERKKALKQLHEAMDANRLDAEDMLWKAVLAYQNYPFHTDSGLAFSYIVKRRKNGEYSGELLVSRKEESKTLTKSSIMLAFQTIRKEAMVPVDLGDDVSDAWQPSFFPGPKKIGLIFGISYIYSLFWKWGLVRVPAKVENRLKGKRK